MSDDDLEMLLDAARKDTLDDDAVARVHRSIAGTGLVATAAAGLKKAFFSTKVFAWIFGATAVAVGAAAWTHHRAPVAIEDTPVLAADRTPASLPSPLALPIHSVAPHDVAIEPTATATATPPPPSPREGLLLLRARQKLGSDPQAARDLVRQHEREFPTSQLALERSTIAREAEERGAH